MMAIRPVFEACQGQITGDKSDVIEPVPHCGAVDEAAHSFVAKIWREESSWRGYIIHVDSGQRRSVKTTAEIVAVFSERLQELGVPLTRWERFCCWMNRMR